MINRPDIVEMMLEKAKDGLTAARKKNVIERLNIYNDYFKDIIKTEVDLQFSEKTRANIKQMIDDSNNLLKRIVNDISVVYQESAQRSYQVNGKDDGRYLDLISKMPLDLITQEVNRLTNLCNETLIYIVPRNGRIDYDILTPDYVEVYQDEDDPTKPVAIIFTQSYVDTKGKTKIYYIYFDVFGNHFKFDEDHNPVRIPDNPEGINPYQDPERRDRTVLPFVIFHKKFPRTQIWEDTSGQDLVSATKQIGVMLTYLNYLFKVQSFKMLYLAGIDIKDVPVELVFDPLFPKVFPDSSGSMGVVDYQIDLRQLWSIIYEKVGVIANNYGLSLDNFKLTVQAQSGFALKIKNSALEKIVNEQKKFYRYYERELFEKTKIVNNSQYKDKIADNGVFKVDFAETEYPESPDEIRNQWKFDIQMGARSILDYVMYVNPDIKTREQAEKQLRDNVELNNRISDELGVNVDKLVESALAQQPLRLTE